MRLSLSVMTCPGRSAALVETLDSIRASDWGEPPTVQLDPGFDPDPKRSQTENARQLLERAIWERPDWVVFLEDDVTVNRHLRANLTAWLTGATFRVGTLYHLKPADAVPCELIGGSQALVIRGDWLRPVLVAWPKFHPALMHDLRIYRSVRDTDTPLIPVHQPNLVQHRDGVPSTWGGEAHTSPTFNLDWKHHE